MSARLLQKILSIFLALFVVLPSFFILPPPAEAQIFQNITGALTTSLSGGGCVGGKGIASRIGSLFRRAEENPNHHDGAVNDLSAAAEAQAAADDISRRNIGNYIQNRLKDVALGRSKEFARERGGELATGLGRKLGLDLPGDVPGLGGGESVPVKDEEVVKRLEELKTFATSSLAIQSQQLKVSQAECRRTHILNPLAWFIAKRVIHSFTTSIVGWINGGGSENPRFVVNTAEFWRSVANEASGLVIDELGAADLLCSPFKPQLQIALRFRHRPIETRFKCTAGDVYQNVAQSAGIFTGGWRDWVKISASQNTFAGAYLESLDEIRKRQAEAVEAAKTDQETGNGFLGVRVCLRQRQTADGPLCERYETRTPGAVIEGLLSDAVSSDLRQLELADEFNEIASALINRMSGWLVSGGSNNRGLFDYSSRLAATAVEPGGGGDGDGEEGGGGGGGQGETTETFRTHRLEVLNRLNVFINRETAYRDTLQGNLDFVSTGRQTADALKQCYQGQLVQNRQNFIAKTNPTIEERSAFDDLDASLALTVSELNASTTAIFEPITADLDGRIEASEAILNEFLAGKNIALRATLEATLAGVEREYLNDAALTGSVHTGFDVQEAAAERPALEVTIAPAKADEELAACKADLEEMRGL